MKTWQKAIVGFAAVLAIAAIIIILWPAPEAKEDPSVKEANTIILYDLNSLGLQDVLVDETDNQVLIRYNEPAGFANRSAVLAIAAVNAPFSERIVVQVFDNFEPKEELKINTSILLGYVSGEITEDELIGKTTTSRLG